MGWGERSCKHCNSCRRPGGPSMETCNIKCDYYEWDRQTQPDTGLVHEAVSRSIKNKSDAMEYARTYAEATSAADAASIPKPEPREKRKGAWQPKKDRNRKRR